MQIPQQVIDHCEAHKMCRGCKLNCVAPVSDRDFDKWLESQIKRVLALYDNQL